MSLNKKTKKELIAIIEAIKDDAYREWLNIGKVCNYATVSIIALGLICFGLVIAFSLRGNSKYLVCSQDKSIIPARYYPKFLNNFSSNNLDIGEDSNHHNGGILFCRVLKDDEK